MSLSLPSEIYAHLLYQAPFLPLLPYHFKWGEFKKQSLYQLASHKNWTVTKMMPSSFSLGSLKKMLLGGPSRHSGKSSWQEWELYLNKDLEPGQSKNIHFQQTHPGLQWEGAVAKKESPIILHSHVLSITDFQKEDMAAVTKSPCLTLRLVINCLKNVFHNSSNIALL